jgi:NADH-quinone oxidoreductase subunit M
MHARRIVALVGTVVLLAIALASPAADWLVGTASAHMGHERPQIGGAPRPKSVAAGPHGRVKIVGDGGAAAIRLLRTTDGTFQGSFDLANVGDGPLRIYRVGVLVDDAGTPRAPGGLSVQIVPGSSPIVAAGEARSYTVTWRPDATGPRELTGYLSVDSDAAATGATDYDPPSIVAIAADGRPPLLHRVLSVAWLAPLLFTLLALFGFRRAAGGERMLQRASSALAALYAVVTILPLATLVRGLGRADGNDGLQHIERSRLFGPFEYFLGVDGVSAVLLAALGVGVLAIVLAMPATHPGTRGTIGFAGVLASGAALVLVAQSLALVTLGYVLATLAISILARRDLTRTRGADRRSGPGASLAGLIGSLALAIATIVLARGSGGGLLADGTETLTSLSIPEIARSSAHGHAVHVDAVGTLLGLPIERGLAVLVITAAVALAPGMPLASWLADVVTEHEPFVGALVASVASLVSVAVLLRILVPLLPQASHWAEHAVLALGATTAILASLSAIFAREAPRAVGELAVAGGGIALLAPLSLTPQGLTAGVALAVTRALALPLLILVVGALVSRTGELRIAKLGGLFRSAPRLAVALALAIVAAGLLPGGSGFWGASLALHGWVGQSPHLALLAFFAVAATAVAHARLGRLLVGEPPPGLSASPSLEPHGGRVPDVFRDERPWLVLLAVAVIVIAFAPRLVLGPTAPTVLDVFRVLDAPGPTQVA